MFCCRAATAALVEKQSHEMLELINEKRSEYMMAESLYMEGHDEVDFTENLQPYPSHAPIPAPPALSKFQIYSDPVEFASVDQIAISVSNFVLFNNNNNNSTPLLGTKIDLKKYNLATEFFYAK